MSPARAKSRKPWGLVLMGGGARGLAHIGVLKALDEAGLSPRIITGTSMGGLVGAFYASGMTPAEIEKLTSSFGDRGSAHRRFLPRRPQTMQRSFEQLMLETRADHLLRNLGIDRGDRVEVIIRRIVGGLRIEDLRIRFACNAVDLLGGREVVFTGGPLYPALRATMSFPLVFEPARKRGRVLIDGGLLNNVPVDLARRLGAGKVVAPDVHRPLRKVPASSVRNSFQLLSRASDIVRVLATERGLEQADLVFRVGVEARTFDFSQTRSIIEKGRKAAERNLPAIRRLIQG